MIKTSELKEMINIKSFTTLKKAYTEGDLPLPIRLSTHSIAWNRENITTWMKNRPRVKGYPDLQFKIPEIQEDATLKFLSLKEVLKISTKKSPTTIYSWMRTGQFPSPIHILERKVGWLEHEILAWVEWRDKHV